MANMWLASLGFSAILVGSFINTADAKIHEYDDKRFTKIANGLYVPGESEALYASKYQDINAASSSGSHSMGKSFIRFDDITFVRTKEAASKQKSTLLTSGLVETLVFEAKDRHRIGGSLFNSDAICCTPKLAATGSCNLGEVLLKRDSSEPEWPKRLTTFFEENKQEVKMSPETLVINKTGRYTIFFMTCDPDLDGILVRGRSVWKNLDGYLPADTAPLMKFYGFMFLAYVVLGLVWFSQVAQFWKDGIQLHRHISLLIVFTMCELAFLYFDLAYLNSAGTRDMEVTVLAVTLSSMRMALTLLLPLFITSGNWIVKPTTSCKTYMMLLLGVLCFVISESLALAKHFGNISENGMTSLMLSFAILGSCWVQWIFRSLWKTLKKLKLNERNTAKLHLYRKFATALVIMVFLSVALVCVEVYVYDPVNYLWQVMWMIPAFWYLLAYALLVLICIYWAPSEKPTKYLYSVELEDEFDEGELSMTESGMKSEDGVVEMNERKSLLDAFIIIFGSSLEER